MESQAQRNVVRILFVLVAALALALVAVARGGGGGGVRWVHPAIETLDQITFELESGTPPEKILERLRNDLRPQVVQLAELDPRD